MAVLGCGVDVPYPRAHRALHRRIAERGGAAGVAGAGLGLAIARGFLEANGGRIRAESLPGQGTSFVIQFPLPAPAPAPAS